VCTVRNIYGSTYDMVVSLLPGSAPGMVVSMFVGISTLKPSAAVDMIMEDICGSFCPCSYKKNECHAKQVLKAILMGLLQIGLSYNM
jgi:hypothetical protein